MLLKIIVIFLIWSVMATKVTARDTEKMEFIDENTIKSLTAAIKRLCDKESCCHNSTEEVINKDTVGDILNNGKVVMVILNNQDQLLMHRDTLTVIEHKTGPLIDYYLVCKSGFGLANTKIIGKLLTVK